jgi:antirestriction protein
MIQQVYVGTYAKYNNGSLKGEWLKVADFGSKADFYTRAAEIHSDEDDPEFMFQDWEGIAGALISETSIDDVVFEVANKDEETIENFNAFVDSMDSTDFSSFEEAFCGRYKSKVDYAESYVDECGMLAEMPENLRYYFDYERFARDLFISDVYFHDATGCVFRRDY